MTTAGCGEEPTMAVASDLPGGQLWEEKVKEKTVFQRNIQCRLLGSQQEEEDLID